MSEAYHRIVPVCFDTIVPATPHNLVGNGISLPSVFLECLWRQSPSPYWVMKSFQIVVTTCSHSQDKLTSMADAGKVCTRFFSFE